jgi:hypothetical protein
MTRITGDRLYGLAVLTLLVLVWLALMVNNRQQRAAEAALRQGSLYYEPWASFGVWCESELDLQQDPIPFTVALEHPPGNRETMNETIRRLVRTGAPPQPWPEDALEKYRVLNTRCKRSWAEVYEQKWRARVPIDALLETPAHPTEADYRQAILRQAYEPIGTAEAALAWFPLRAEPKP